MPDGVNRYAYTGNDPVNFTDPSGKFIPFIVGAIETAPEWVPPAIAVGKAAVGFVLGYGGAAVTGTESTAGRVAAGVAGAAGLWYGPTVAEATAVRLGGTALAKAGSTVAVSGLVGGAVEFGAQVGDTLSGVGEGFNVGKIGGMVAVTAGASLLGGEAAVSALGLKGGAQAVADIWGAAHTAAASYAGSKMFYPTPNASSVPISSDNLQILGVATLGSTAGKQSMQTMINPPALDSSACPACVTNATGYTSLAFKPSK
jgi:hypothetical protein